MSKVEKLQKDLTQRITEVPEDQYQYVTNHPGEYTIGTLQGVCEMAGSIKNQMIMSGYDSSDLASIVDDHEQKVVELSTHSNLPSHAKEKVPMHGSSPHIGIFTFKPSRCCCV
jgi:hypothetical protein